MSRARPLERRLHVLGVLGEAVSALRALSAQHFRQARAALPPARAYRAGIEAARDVLAGAPPTEAVATPVGVLVVAADLGLCGDYTARLAAEATRVRAALGPGPMLCIGQRARGPLARAGTAPTRVYAMPASPAALSQLLVPLVDDIVADRRAGRLGGLELVAARFEGAGHFTPACVRLLPVVAPPGARPVPASPYASAAYLRTVVVREYLYVALHETLLDALAAEHGKRLVTAESAHRWLEERTAATRRRLSAVRREAATQEVLEVVAGVRTLERGAER